MKRPSAVAASVKRWVRVMGAWTRAYAEQTRRGVASRSRPYSSPSAESLPESLPPARPPRRPGELALRLRVRRAADARHQRDAHLADREPREPGRDPPRRRRVESPGEI